jgi:hypothetical protein
MPLDFLNDLNQLAGSLNHVEGNDKNVSLAVVLDSLFHRLKKRVGLVKGEVGQVLLQKEAFGLELTHAGLADRVNQDGGHTL